MAETAAHSNHVSSAHVSTEATEHSKQLLRSHAVLGPWLRLVECVMGGGRPNLDCIFGAI